MENYTEIAVYDLEENQIGGCIEDEKFEDYTDQEITDYYISKFGEDITIDRIWYKNNLPVKSTTIYENEV